MTALPHKEKLFFLKWPSDGRPNQTFNKEDFDSWQFTHTLTEAYFSKLLNPTTSRQTRASSFSVITGFTAKHWVIPRHYSSRSQSALTCNGNLLCRHFQNKEMTQSEVNIVLRSIVSFIQSHWQTAWLFWITQCLCSGLRWWNAAKENCLIWTVLDLPPPNTELVCVCVCSH